uniref:NADH-ubiquinone oxidoreductase chain 2 n=1 Tax=Thaumaglossa rufocapillata TaxID=3080387 RepID=A0AA97AJW4_9COLE|nr:NADH dehydrogenase subunit 2 [Thaumaglossa rufocapillata]WNZ33689.1 NADH dehydrogenase subunit 2 [Thaumaglossa rufocapillata]
MNIFNYFNNSNYNYHMLQIMNSNVDSSWNYSFIVHSINNKKTKYKSISSRNKMFYYPSNSLYNLYNNYYHWIAPSYSYPISSNMKIQLFSMNSAIFTKMGAAPFHFWFPEVIEGLNWTSSLILLTWQKIAPMTIMMETNKSFTFLSLIMMTSIMISGIMGINQTSMKKILAYSSINHTGWMLGTMMSNKTTWLIYLIIYSAMTANLILIFKKINVINIAQMTKQMNKNKMMKMTMCINFLSMGGIPPFIGFFPKWVVINSMINTEMLMLTFMMITATLMTIFFYLRIMINSLLSSKTEETYKQEKTMSMYSIIKMNCLTLMSLMITPLLTIMI